MIGVKYGPVFCTVSLPASMREDLLMSFRVRNPEYDASQENASDVPEFCEFYDRESGYIFTGLVSALHTWAAKRKLPVTWEDWPHDPLRGWGSTPFTVARDCLPGITLKDHQMDAMSKALTAGRGVIELPTGSGKTLCAVALTSILGKPRTVYLCPDCSSMHQTYESYVKRGFDSETEVGRLGDDLYEVDRPVVICVVNSAYAGIRNRDPVVVGLLDNAELFISDEVHHQGTAFTWKIVAAQCKAQRRYGLSGTPYKDPASRFNPSYIHPVDSFLTGLIGPTIVYVPPSMLQDKGELAKCRVISFPAGGSAVTTGPVMNAWMAKAIWRKVYRMGIVENGARNAKVCTIAANLSDAGGIPLISVESLAHGRELQRELWSVHQVPSVCSYGSDVRIVPRSFAEEVGAKFEDIEVLEDKPNIRKGKKRPKLKVVGQEEDFVQLSKKDKTDVIEHLRRGKLAVLIGSRIYDEALDIPFLTDLINASGGKADQRYRQKVGRVLRNSSGKGVARIWDPWDNCHSYLDKHSALRLASAEAQGWPVTSTAAEGMDWIYDVRAGKLLLVTEEVEMKNKEVEISCELTIPVGGKDKFMFVKPRVALRATLDEGDDLEACRARLSNIVRGMFLQEALRQAGTLEEIARKGFVAAAKDYLELVSPKA
jgi:hypothetical protein